MFVKSYMELGVDFATVRDAILLRPPRWLDGLMTAAEEDGTRLLTEVGLAVGGHVLSRRAWLEVGDSSTTDRVAFLPLHMRVEDHERLFPALHGTLDAAWLGPGRTHLALSAQYAPPFGLIGRIVDRTLFHRVAEVVAQRFLARGAQHLASMAGSQLESDR
jgi:hypothetical protein